MFRKFVCGVFAFVICAGVSLAEDLKGKIKSVDAEKNTITVTIGDKDQTFTLDKDAKILDTKGKEVAGGIKASLFKKAGLPVTVTTEKKDDKDVVTKVKLTS